MDREGQPAVASSTIDPALQLLLSTSGTTGSQKYVRLSRDAVVANARQIAEALAIDEASVGIAHLPLHYSYGLSVVTSHLAAGGRICLVNDSITSPSFWSKIGSVGGSHFPGVPFHYAALARLGSSLVPDCVKVFTQAGGALDLRIQTKMHDWATQRGGRFFVMYGQTEASPRMATLQHADLLAQRRDRWASRWPAANSRSLTIRARRCRPTRSGRWSTKAPTSCWATPRPGPTSARATR